MHHRAVIPDKLSENSGLSAVKSADGLLSRDELLAETSLSALALKKLEENGFVKPEENGTDFYSYETAGHLKSMVCTVEAQAAANLFEANEIALSSAAEKARRELTAAGSSVKTIDPRKIRTHPEFENLLRVDESVHMRLIAGMRRYGYYVSKPVILGTWEGQPEPVLIDGHCRRDAAIQAGIDHVPFVIEEFRDEEAALAHAISLQTIRRITRDDSVIRLLERCDELVARGGDRRSREAKPKPTSVGIEMGRSSSAHRMAHMIGCNRGKVEKARKILRDGTPEIIDSVRNGKMTINKAYNIVIKKPARSRAPVVKLTTRTVEALKDLGGNMQDHVEAAVKLYIERLHEEGFTAENAEIAEK